MPRPAGPKHPVRQRARSRSRRHRSTLVGPFDPTCTHPAALRAGISRPDLTTKPRYDAAVARADRKQPVPDPSPGRWPAAAVGVTLLLSQLAVLPGSASPFRTPKQSVLLTGLLVVVAFALIREVARGAVSLPRGPLSGALVALPLLQGLSALWSDDPYRAVESASQSAVLVVATLWIAGLESRHRGRLLRWCAVGATVSAAILLLQAAGVEVVPLVGARGRYALTGLTGNPADLSIAGILLLPLLLVAPGDEHPRWWRWPTVLILAAVPVVSRTLSGIVAVGAVAVVWVVLQRSWKVWAGAACAVVALTALGVGVGLGERIGREMDRVREGDWYSLLSARGDGWSAAVEMAASRPLGGVGAGCFTHAYYPSRLAWLERRQAVGRRGELATHFEWAHCDPLQHLAELGAVGALWLVALAWAFLRSARHVPRLAVLSAAAVGPFLLLHYPTHLAVGLMPIVLTLAAITSGEPRAVVAVQSKAARWVVGAALLGAVAAGLVWQLRTLALDVWRADLERRIADVQAATVPEQRVAGAAAIEREVLSRVHRLPSASGWLWRIVGKALLVRGQPRDAEEAFRAAVARWPHEEAELGLGIALAGQGRRGEALVHLGRVCRVNPSLAAMIADPSLRRAVTDLTATRRERSPG